MILIADRCELPSRMPENAAPRPAYEPGTGPARVDAPLSDNLHRLAVLRALNIEYIDSAVYHQSDIDAEFEVEQSAQSPRGRAAAPFRPTADTPAHLARLCEEAVLTRHEEVSLFHSMNYLKFVASEAIAALDDAVVSAEQLDAIDRQLAEARQIRDRLVSSNMRLVMSIAGKMARSANVFDELLSEGCVVLMKAVEKFNVERGFRFSTYAVTALHRQFARVLGKMATRRVRTADDPDMFLAGIADHTPAAAEDLVKRIDIQSDIRQMLDGLNERERFIVCARYGIGDNKHGARTLKDIAAVIGISKERVRQIQHRALEKMKEMFQGSALAERLDQIAAFPNSPILE